MASTGVDVPSSAMSESIMSGQEKEKKQFDSEKHEEAGELSHSDSPSSAPQYASDLTHRQLRPRHIQLIGIGGTIGTALYVQIGRGLLNGGPGSLFLAFTIWYVVFLEYLQREMRTNIYLSILSTEATESNLLLRINVIGVHLSWLSRTVSEPPLRLFQSAPN